MGDLAKMEARLIASGNAGIGSDARAIIEYRQACVLASTRRDRKTLSYLWVYGGGNFLWQPSLTILDELVLWFRKRFNFWRYL